MGSLGLLALIVACAEPPHDASVPAADPEPAASAPVPEPAPDRAAEIQAKNQAILDRLESEQLAREKKDAPKTEVPPPPAPEPEAAPSGMEEMEARASALEPRVAAIGDKAARIDESYRRYMEACYEKYTTAMTSPHTAALYYEPYQPISISNETTPRCRELWSDIETEGHNIQLELQSLADEARHRGVLPGHLRALIRKYHLDREGWRP